MPLLLFTFVAMHDAAAFAAENVVAPPALTACKYPGTLLALGTVTT